jgi:hypothetical protein
VLQITAPSTFQPAVCRAHAYATPVLRPNFLAEMIDSQAYVSSSWDLVCAQEDAVHLNEPRGLASDIEERNRETWGQGSGRKRAAGSRQPSAVSRLGPALGLAGTLRLWFEAARCDGYGRRIEKTRSVTSVSLARAREPTR